MFDAFYEFLAKIGYTHPPHPMVLHIPIGMMIGAFLLAVAALLFRRPGLAQSARHCVIIVLIFYFPAVLTGVMDWQQYFFGAWLDPITIKVVLASVWLFFLLAGIFLGRKGKYGSKAVLATYALCFFAIVGIGYYGAELAFGNKAPEAPPEYREGEKIYARNCGACHPFGGNIVNAKLSVMGAPEFIDFRVFLRYLRDPKQPKGAIAIMPIVPATKISDEQAKKLFDYVTKVLERPRRPLDPTLYPMPSS
jgi:mono/diheme cytochrome c family protein